MDRRSTFSLLIGVLISLMTPALPASAQGQVVRAVMPRTAGLPILWTKLITAHNVSTIEFGGLLGLSASLTSSMPVMYWTACRIATKALPQMKVRSIRLA